jgi:hypothetical protein
MKESTPTWFSCIKSFFASSFISLAILNPELVFSLLEADVYIAVIVLTDVKPYEKLFYS